MPRHRPGRRRHGHVPAAASHPDAGAPPLPYGDRAPGSRPLPASRALKPPSIQPHPASGAASPPWGPTAPTRSATPSTQQPPPDQPAPGSTALPPPASPATRPLPQRKPIRLHLPTAPRLRLNGLKRLTREGSGAFGEAVDQVVARFIAIVPDEGHDDLRPIECELDRLVIAGDGKSSQSVRELATVTDRLPTLPDAIPIWSAATSRSEEGVGHLCPGLLRFWAVPPVGVEPTLDALLRGAPLTSWDTGARQGG